MRGAGIRLFARLLASPGFFLADQADASLPYAYRYYQAHPDELPEFYDHVLKLTPHFPYGYDVEPD